MRQLLPVLAAAVLIAFAGHAQAGPLYFTAYKGDKKAEVRDAKTRLSLASKEIRAYSQADFDRLPDSKKKENSETIVMCEARYFLSKKDLEWRKAHLDAKHEIRVREHISPGRYQVLCPKPVPRPPTPPAEPPSAKIEEPPAPKTETPKAEPPKAEPPKKASAKKAVSKAKPKAKPKPEPKPKPGTRT